MKSTTSWAVHERTVVPAPVSRRRAISPGSWLPMSVAISAVPRSGMPSCLLPRPVKVIATRVVIAGTPAAD
ncbi:MAG: hypothetical protein H7231_11555 [Rhodoferax sp.]|nr:hypothetical protein [Actinomycetota bacterium]